MGYGKNTKLYNMGSSSWEPVCETRRGYVEASLRVAAEVLGAHQQKRELILGYLEELNADLCVAIRSVS